ncbi:hypothetical protein BKA70DRAFT_1479735 [Coprinopsis sp. MPI-PUGE-AT-0042]|nr:hypothetical protein BKA70DRAFT_1479735 [Coprinopsis sp. MPI-PUGE-AT-0042]
MVSNLQLQLYANSNEPLPEKLHGTLHSFLNQLEVQWKAQERDRTRVVEAIESRHSMIEALELEIQGFSRFEIRLNEGQQALRTKYRRYATTTTSFRRMPPEVVATIIQFAVQGPYGSLHRKDRLFFAQIRSVCKLWRETSFSTHSLWRAVALDMGQIFTINPRLSMKAYISDHLGSWFRRGGATFLASRIPHPYKPLPYGVTRCFSKSISRPLPVKILTIEFKGHSHHQPLSSEIIHLTQNFPNVSILSLVESISPLFSIPISFARANLFELHLTKPVVLSYKEMALLLPGVPRLRRLGLDQCVGRRHANMGTSSLTHASISTLTFTSTLPEACFEEFAFPSSKYVYIGGKPRSLRYHANEGRVFSQFLQRCGGPIDFYLDPGWPSQVVENILNSNTAIEVVIAPSFSAFRVAPKTGGRRLIQIPALLKGIEIPFVPKGTKSQLLEFCNSLVLADEQVLTVDAPCCLPSGVAFFPWPRPENGPPYILCRGRLRDHSGLVDHEL